jgi:hypothetical protein
MTSDSFFIEVPFVIAVIMVGGQTEGLTPKQGLAFETSSRD